MAKENGLYFLTDLTLPKIAEFRNTWKVGDVTAQKTPGAPSRLLHLLRQSWMDSTESGGGAEQDQIRSKPTDWFTDEEFKKLIDATYLFDNRDKRSAELSRTRVGCVPCCC